MTLSRARARAYYNEFDPFAAQWLRNLIAAGAIPEGDVDERSIADVCPADLVGYTQHHFFAGVAGWPVALRLAGWPDDRPVTSGSCPCQPYSSAGKGKGDEDPRNLWPVWFNRLLREYRPSVCFGEQVANAIGHGWLDRVFADLEGEGYACGAAVLPAAGVGAPHLRQRMFWVAQSQGAGGRQDAGAVRGGSAEGLSEKTGQDTGRAGEQARRAIDLRATDRTIVGVAHGDTNLTREDVLAEGRGSRPATDQSGGIDRAAADTLPLADNDGRRQQVRPQPDGEPEGRGGEPASRRTDAGGRGGPGSKGGTGDCGVALGDTAEPRLPGGQDAGADRGAAGEGRRGEQPERAGSTLLLGHADDARPQGRGASVRGGPVNRAGGGAPVPPGAPQSEPSPWSDYRIIPCRDGKSRRVSAQPGDEPLAHGILRTDSRSIIAALQGMGLDPGAVKRLKREASRLLASARRNRTGRLKAYGNAVVPQLAAVFIRAFMLECH